MSKINVGDVVYLKPTKLGNAIRVNKSIKETTIEKVGRKYVTVSNGDRYHIEDGSQKTEFASDYDLFWTEDDLNRKIEQEELSNRIKRAIPKYGDWNLELEKLRKIAAIIGC